MSEGSNVPRNQPRNKSWLHSEPCRRTRKLLAETRTVDFATDIDNLRRAFANQVRRILSYGDDESERNETAASIDSRRDYTFGEIDTSILPQPAKGKPKKLRQRRNSDSDVSVSSYDSSVFDPVELKNEDKMAHASNQEPPKIGEEAIDREINRIRADMAQRSQILGNGDRVLRTSNNTVNLGTNRNLNQTSSEELRQILADATRILGERSEQTENYVARTHQITNHERRENEYERRNTTIGNLSIQQNPEIQG